MVLVVFAVMVAMVLSMAFLGEQTTSGQMSRNIVNANQARMIAESGLQMAIVYIQVTPTWRTAQVPGNWVAKQAFAGGTFTVNAVDGWDSDGDGAIEGNADFSDPTHAVTLTVTSTYKGRYGRRWPW